jgi:hypothetical protein
MKHKTLLISILIFSTFLVSAASENQRQIIYLSGKAYNDIKTWI